MMTESSVDNIQWPCDLSGNLKQQLLNIAQPREGLQRLPEVSGIYHITHGLAILYYTADYMNNNLGFVFGTHDWIGARTIADNPKLFLQHIELEPIKYLFFPRKKILLLAENNHEVYKLLYFCLAKVQPIHLQAQLTAMHDKEVRIAYTLLALAKKKTSNKRI
jgi:CRP/FNR family cyclic AMP-dependent transcriptional regulator